MLRKKSGIAKPALHNVTAVLAQQAPPAEHRQIENDNDSSGYAKVPVHVLPLEVDKAPDVIKPTIDLSELRKYYVPDFVPPCPCGAGAEDISYRHDAQENITHCQPAQTRRQTRLSSVVTAEHSLKTGTELLLGDESAHLPANSRTHLINLREDFKRTQSEWRFEDRVGAVENPRDVVRLINSVIDEEIVLDAIFYDVIRQAGAECEARGQILDVVRKKYIGLFSSLPEPLENMARDLVKQRGIDKTFAELLLNFQAWWRRQEFPVANVRQSQAATVTEIENSLETLNKQVPKFEDEARHLKDLSKIHAAYRARTEQDIHNLTTEAEDWQDLAYMLCAKVIKDEKLVKVVEMNVMHQVWHRAAKKRYKALRTADETDILKLETLQKDLIGVLQQIETKLLHQESRVVKLLQTLRTDLDRSLFVSLFYENRGKIPATVKSNVTESLKDWMQLLKKIEGNLQTDDENSQLTRQLKSAFTTLVRFSLELFLRYHKREEFMATDHEGSPLNGFLGTLVFIPRPVGKLMENVEQAPTRERPLTSFELENSWKGLEDMFNSTEVKALEKSPFASDTAKNFRESVLYASTYRLWETYSAMHKSLTNRLGGTKKFRESTGRMSEKVIKCLQELSQENTFRQTLTGTFRNTAVDLLDQTQSVLTLMSNDFFPSPSAKNQNILRKFFGSVVAWYCSTEDVLRKSTASVSTRISILSENMGKTGIDLVTTLFSMGLDSDKNSVDASRIEEIRARLESIHGDVARISEVLDNVQPDSTILHQHSLWTEDIDESITGHAHKWRIYSALCINFAHEACSHSPKNFLPDSRLASYNSEDLKEDVQFDKTGSDFDDAFRNAFEIPPSLKSVTHEPWPKSDKLKIRCLGEDENVYFKQFRLMTKSNVLRELSSPSMEKFLALSENLAKEKLEVAGNIKRLMELERELATVNAQNQLLDIELQHWQALQTGSQPPAVLFPPGTLAEMEEEMHRAGILPPLLRPADEGEAALPALQSWTTHKSRNASNPLITDTVLLVS